MVFFSAVVLPAFFIELETHRAGAMAALLFPRYNFYGIICATLACASGLLLWIKAGSVWRSVAVIASVMLAIQAYVTFSLHPEVAMIRGKTEHKARFDVLHRRSVRVNGILLVAGLGILVWGGRRLGEH